MAKEIKNEDFALEALLGSDINVEQEVPIKRLGASLRVKAIAGEQLTAIQEQCTHYVGKGANQTKQLDETKFGKLLISTACVSPNFGDSRLLEKFGAIDAADCVQKALLAGEIAKLTSTVMEISGFDNDIDEIKN
jgi:Phage XkdN-like tail assembly chaperone protein, TAC